MKIPRAIQNLTEAFERLPGIGSKTAARLTFYLLHVPEAERQRLGQAVLELGEKTAICERCFNIATPSSSGEKSLCEICSDLDRDSSMICVVEEPLDLMAFERAGKYHGLYHVLHGVIAPLDHIGPEDLKIDELMKRIKASEPKIGEIILALNPSLEGEATAMYLKQLIKKQEGEEVKVTRIARGIPTGGDLEYADETTLTRALEGRQEY